MTHSISYEHNAKFQPEELIKLFTEVGFNRLGEWNKFNIQAIFEHTDYYIVAKQGQKLVGFVRLLTDWHTRAYISNLCVNPALQNQGIGRTLLSEILSVCDEKGILVTNVYDTSDNPKFYQQFGFEADVNAVGLHRILPGAKSLRSDK
ncbi:MAG: GNAT family N-acetyltransferase [Chromatiales bacterium]|jgi:N-acetylglutamate synthase-like GNAT family acetyltransferase